MNKKYKRNSSKYSGRIAIFSLFCAAAGVYAADIDGWKYKDEEKTVIENAGNGNIPRIAPIAKDGKFDDDSFIGSVSKVEIAAGNPASFVYDIPSLKDNPLEGVIFDGSENSLHMAEGAVLNVDSTTDRGGQAIENRDATGVIFSADAQNAVLTGNGKIDVNASGNATGISGTNVGDISINSVSATAAGEGNSAAISISGNAGNITAESLSASSESGQGIALNVSGNAGNISAGSVTGDVSVAGNAESVVIGTANGNVSLGKVLAGGTDADVINSIKNLTGSAPESYSVAIKTANGDVNVGENQSGIYVESVSGKLTAGKASGDVYVGSADSIDVNLDKSRLEAQTVSGDARINGEGNANIGTADSITIDTGLKGDLQVASTNTADIKNLDGNAYISRNDGEVNVETISGKLSAYEANGNINVNGSAGALDVNLAGADLTAQAVSGESKVNGTGNVKIGSANTVSIDSLTGDAYIGSNENLVSVGVIDGKLTAANAVGNVEIKDHAASLDVNLAGGSLDAQMVQEDAMVNGKGNATIHYANRVTTTELDGDLTIDSNTDVVNVETISGKLTASEAHGDINVVHSAGSVDVNLADGNLNAEKVIGDSVVNGRGNATIGSANNVTSTMLEGNMEIGSSTGVVEVENIRGKLGVADAQGEVIVKNSVGSLDVTLNENGGSLSAESVENTAIVNGTGNAVINNANDVIVDNLTGDMTIGSNLGTVNVDTINGKLTAYDAQGDINVSTSAEAVDANLNGGNLNAGSAEIGEAIINGAGNASIGNAGSVGVTAGLQGNIEVNGSVETVSIENGLTGDLTVNQNTGAINADTIGGSLSVSDAQGDINLSVSAGSVDVNLNGGNLNAETATVGQTSINGQGNAVIGTNIGEIQVDKLDGKLTVADAQANININSASDVDVTLSGTELTAETIGGNVKVAGEGNASIEKAQSLEVATEDGTLSMGGQSVSIDGSKLSVDVSTVADGGNVKAGDLDSVNIDKVSPVGTEAASVNVGNVAGDVNIEGSTVNFGADSVGGNVAIDTLKGNATFGQTLGQVQINGTGMGMEGILTIADAQGNITANADIESVDVTFTNNSDMNIANIKGDAKVELAGGSFSTTGTIGGTADISGFGNVAFTADSIDIKTTSTDDIKIDTDKNVTITPENPEGGLTANIKVTGEEFAFADANTVSADALTGNVTVNGSAGSVDITNGLTGNLTVNQNTGAINADTISGTLTASHAQGDINVSGSAGSLDVNLEGSKLSANDVVNDAKINGNGAAEIASAGSVTVGSFEGEINVSSLETADINSVAGSVTISENTGDMKIGSVSEKLTLSSVKGGNSTVSSVNELDATVNGGSLNVENVKSEAVVAVNSGEFNVEIAENAKLTANGGKSVLSTINNKLTALLNGGEVQVDSVKDAEISGGEKGGAIVISSATGTIDASTTSADKFVENGSGIGTSGKLNISITQADTVNMDTVNGGDIQGMTQIKNLHVANNVGELNIGTSADVSGNIVIDNSSANIAIGNVENLDVTLSNDASLVANDGTWVSGKAVVNGGCDATYSSVNELVVDRGLDGNLIVKETVNTADINNVSGVVDINTVAVSANIANSASAVVENAQGSVSFDTLSGSATVNNASAQISAKDVAGGLNIGNVAGVDVANTDVNVLDGKTVSGDIVSTTDMALSNGGSAILAGKVIVDGTLDVKSDGFSVSGDSNGAHIKAGNIAGENAVSLVDNFYDQKYGFSAQDESLIKVSTLVGTHDADVASSDGSDAKNGHIEGALADGTLSVSNAYVDVDYSNKNNAGSSTNTVNYTVTRNSYLQDVVAKTENEKALAKVYDNLAYQNDAVADAASVAKKQTVLANPSLLGAMLPQSVAHAAKLNMDLADMIHLDTLFRTSATRDMLLSLGRDLNKRGRTDELVRGTTIVSVRNMNRFSSYDGDANVGGSSDSIYGGLANIEYIANSDFFAGIGVGGFQAKSNGKGTCGDAETQSFALNAYADYAFYPNFDWYIGISYAYGMNEVERQGLEDTNKGEWDSNMIGVFTGVRYAWKPIASENFFIKPTIGVNANFLLNPSFGESGKSELLDVDSADYTSVKTLVGFEATYSFWESFYVAGRMFYTHEFGDDSYDTTAMFINSGSTVSSFRVKGWEMDRDAGVFGIGVGYDITKALRVYVDYSAEVSNEVYHNLNAGIQFRF